MRISTHTRKIIQLSICTFLAIACFLAIFFLSRGISNVIRLGSFILPFSHLQGIISSTIMFLCILMVLIHYDYGYKISLCLIFLSLCLSTSQIFRSHTLHSLAGVASATTSFISLTVIYYFFKKSVINNYTDLITGFSNRKKFMEELQDKISEKKEFQLACVEIEDFNQINDLYGIQAGDYVLKDTAKYLQDIVGEKNKVYKLAGATFAIIFDFACDAEKQLSAAITQRTITLKNDDESNLIKTAVFSLTAGIASFPKDGAEATKLFKNTDSAMCAAKRSPNKKIYVYSSELENAELKQKEAENLIHESLENNYFYLVYQPQFSITDKKLRGFETLIRCRRPDGGIVSPALFIPAAEKSNLILKIDDYVLKRAMKEFKPVLQQKGENYTISVNVSEKNIGSEDFTQRIKAMLEETDFPAKCLEIEITEYSLAESLETTISNITSLRNIGVQVALDDFGTGYTSISQLMKLPINLLKIDKSLIDDIENNNNIQDLVDSVIYMGHIMNCEVISEGVETEQQIGVLKDRKCDFVQGFVWGKPLAFSDAVSLFDEIPKSV